VVRLYTLGIAIFVHIPVHIQEKVSKNPLQQSVKFSSQIILMDQRQTKIWEYLDRFIPIATQCFFPKIKNKRCFRWPGITSAAWCLCLETFYVLFSLIIMTVIILVDGFLLFSGIVHETIVPGLPPASSSKKGKLFPVTRLDVSKGEVTPAIVKEFVSRSEPLIIKNLPKELFSVFASGGPYSPPVSEELKQKGTLNMNVFLLPSLGKFSQWISEHVGKPAWNLVRFSGSYKSGYAHIDMGGTYNIYYVARGRKKVRICPRQYNHLLPFESGYNSAFIPGSHGHSPSSFMYIKKVPGVWGFDLEEGDLLIFNNTACVHKFINLTKNPLIFSTRVLNLDMSPVAAKNDILNYDLARFALSASFFTKTPLELPNGKDGITKSAEYSEDDMQLM